MGHVLTAFKLTCRKVVLREGYLAEISKCQLRRDADQRRVACLACNFNALLAQLQGLLVGAK